MIRPSLLLAAGLALAASAHAEQFMLSSADIKPNAVIADEQVFAGFMINANSIGKATLTGKYGRQK